MIVHYVDYCLVVLQVVLSVTKNLVPLRNKSIVVNFVEIRCASVTNLCFVFRNVLLRLLSLNFFRLLNYLLIDFLCFPCRMLTSFGADNGNRTRITNLEGWGSAIELHLHGADGGT